MIIKQPYFMKNEEWYKDDKAKGTLVLTDKAPVKAKLSYKKFYDKLNSDFGIKGNDEGKNPE